MAIRVETARSGDIAAASDIMARHLDWTKSLLMPMSSLSEEDLSFLVSQVRADNRKYSFGGSSTLRGVLLVARADKEEIDSCRANGRDALPYGDIVGCVILNMTCFQGGTPMDESYYFKPGTVVSPLLECLAVVPGFRGRRVGRQLVEAAERCALQWGYEEIVLLVEFQNLQAQAVYDKLGYRWNGLPVWAPTSYLEKPPGGRRVKETKVPALRLRKSLKPFPIGPLENLNWGPLAGLLAAAAYAQQNPQAVSEVTTVLQAAGVDQVISSLDLDQFIPKL